MATARKKVSVHELQERLKQDLAEKRLRSANRLPTVRVAIPDRHADEVLDAIYRYGNLMEEDDVNTGCTVVVTAPSTMLDAANARANKPGQRDF
jgi:NADP-dependent 3-hydroxy acid dehydrogenase YdfG